MAEGYDHVSSYGPRFLGIMRQTLFPRRCPYCRDIIVPGGSLICPDCEPQLPFIRGRSCEKCGKQLRESRGDKQPVLCQNCQKHERSFSFSLALLNYDGVSAEIMAGFKYLHKKEYADTLAWLICKHLGADLRTLGAQAVVPVPVHAKRKRERGYNQAEALGRSLCTFLNVGYPALFLMGLSEDMLRDVRLLKEYQEKRVRSSGIGVWGRNGDRPPENVRFQLMPDLLIRTKNTRAQKNLGAAERLMNLQRAFSVSPKYARGASAKLPEAVLLIDDIYTTGATMEACTRALFSAGVKKVFGLCVCAGRDV